VLAAIEATGMDPQLGFLHGDRPGRPSLALDLMEELRPTLADRALLSLINNRQLRPRHFAADELGAVLLTAEGRKIVLGAWSQRRERTVHHPLLNQETTWGLLPHLQARILARHLRGEIDRYVPFVLPG
jgi:CRISPR-associated protein Cas1